MSKKLKNTMIDAIRHIKSVSIEPEKEIYKPFYTMYVKQRSKYNPLRFLLGDKYSISWFEKDKQPKGYIHYVQYFVNNINLNTKDIKFKKQ